MNMKKQYRKTYKIYQAKLSNLPTVVRDTNYNLITAEHSKYNCMSYALGLFDQWCYLDAFDDAFNDAGCGVIDYEQLDKIFTECCIELEKKFHLRRLISSEEKLNTNERMIAFRIGADDFHFVRQNSDGTWTHKPGTMYVREMDKEELFSNAWGTSRKYPYISEIAFFAVKM